jgi:hypothetical protein
MQDDVPAVIQLAVALEQRVILWVRLEGVHDAFRGKLCAEDGVVSEVCPDIQNRIGVLDPLREQDGLGHLPIQISTDDVRDEITLGEEELKWLTADSDFELKWLLGYGSH